MAPEILKPSRLIPRVPRKREEPFPRIKRADMFGKKPKMKMAGFLYPVMTESEAAKFILSKKKSKKA